MQQLTTKYYKWANGSLLITTIAYLLINGAGAFETAVIVPVWTSNPPASLNIFKGEYALDFKAFWIIAHSLHELTFISALILNWKIPGRRKILLIVFVLHIAIRVWTLIFFAPTVISFQQMAPSDTVDEILRQKAQTWKNLNLIRVIAFTILSFVLIPLNKRHLKGSDS